MSPEQERKLLKRCFALAQRGETQLSASVSTAEVSRYTDARRYARELERIFRGRALALAHVSELPEANSFLTVNSPQGSLLLTCNSAGRIQAFHNVCRHRGTRLVDPPRGCAARFRCPYHAWTYTNDGALVGVPQQDQMFPDLNRPAYGLKALPCATHFGLIWVGVQPGGWTFGGLNSELAALRLDEMRIYASETRVCRANWKIIAEGGLEAYHFRHAHRATIAPSFCDNLALYEAFGTHLRMILPRRSLAELPVEPPPGSLRAHAHLIYALFPGTTLLVQADHVVWIRALPLEPDRTAIQVSTLVPVRGPGANRPDRHWRSNHQITCATLGEDFTLAESIQNGLHDGANETLLFGRGEGALGLFKHIVDESL